MFIWTRSALYLSVDRYNRDLVHINLARIRNNVIRIIEPHERPGHTKNKMGRLVYNLLC